MIRRVRSVGKHYTRVVCNVKAATKPQQIRLEAAPRPRTENSCHRASAAAAERANAQRDRLTAADGLGHAMSKSARNQASTAPDSLGARKSVPVGRVGEAHRAHRARSVLTTRRTDEAYLLPDAHARRAKAARLRAGRQPCEMTASDSEPSSGEAR